MKRSRQASRSKFKVYALSLVAVIAIGGGLMALRSHNEASVLSAVSTPESRNDLRKEHLKLLSAALTNYVGQLGKLPVAIPTAATPICSGTGAVCKTTKQVDLMIVSSKGYIVAIPNDPSGGPGQHTTGYTIQLDTAAKQLRIAAPRAEKGAVIDETINYR